jgi:hypothetical protein
MALKTASLATHQEANMDGIFCVTSENRDQYPLIDHIGWYFWDEAGLENGPFSTKEETEKILKQYIDTYL